MLGRKRHQNMSVADKLYEAYDTLSVFKTAGGDPSAEHKQAYSDILAPSTNPNPAVRRLVVQFLGEFAGLIPDLVDSTAETILTFCEDTESTIRQEAIRIIPKVFSAMPDQRLQLVHALAQLLATEDASELAVVKNALDQVVKSDLQASIAGLISQIVESEDSSRSAGLNYLCEFIKTDAGKQSLHGNIENERFLLEEVKKILSDVTREEFVQLVNLLKTLKIFSTKDCGQEMVDLLAAQANLDTDFEINEDNMDRLIACMHHARPFFRRNGSTTVFLKYAGEHLFKHFKDFDLTSGLAVQLFRSIADLCMYDIDPAAATEVLPAVHSALLVVLPEPPETIETEEMPSLNFSFIEALLFIAHRLGGKSPSFFQTDAQRLKGLRDRLNWATQVAQAYLQQLTNVENKDDAAKENLKTTRSLTDNIKLLVKGFFHDPPSFQTAVKRSWIKPRPAQPANALKSALGSKRKTSGLTSPAKRTKGQGQQQKPQNQRNNNKKTQNQNQNGQGGNNRKRNRNHGGGKRQSGGGGNGGGSGSRQTVARGRRGGRRGRGGRGGRGGRNRGGSAASFLQR
eukprot:m.56933 g.56933  ORF g.56933 m.56933 type:complete len:570 (+) comp18822_c0_seq1:79-1788(+)